MSSDISEEYCKFKAEIRPNGRVTDLFFLYESLGIGIRWRLKTHHLNGLNKYKTKSNYDAYARACYQVTLALSESVTEKELFVAQNIETNPKVCCAFFNYVSSKSKPKGVIPSLTKPDGLLTETNKNKAWGSKHILCRCIYRGNYTTYRRLTKVVM